MQIKLKVILIVICDWMTLHGKLFNILDWIANCAVGSPVSANKPEGRENHTKGATSGSSEPSDEDDEAGPCEQSTNAIDVKRLRRYIYLYLYLKHLKLMINNKKVLNILL